MLVCDFLKTVLIEQNLLRIKFIMLRSADYGSSSLNRSFVSPEGKQENHSYEIVMWGFVKRKFRVEQNLLRIRIVMFRSAGIGSDGIGNPFSHLHQDMRTWVTKWEIF